MRDRIPNAFFHKKAFIGFITAGDPSIGASEEIIKRMIEAGCDLVEIGIPFSDPIAEGPVIEEANARALGAGTNIESVFLLAGRIREYNSEIPLVFLTYLNPVFHYGYEEFFQRMKDTGMDGIIIPDLPYEEKDELLPIAKKNDIDVITLIAPTSKERVTKLAADATGFIYLVSSLGVTGTRGEITTNLSEIIETIRAVSDTPVAVGFGIHTEEQAASIGQIADGVIVGSAIVRLIGNYGEGTPGEGTPGEGIPGEKASEIVFEYVKKMKDALRACNLVKNGV